VTTYVKLGICKSQFGPINCDGTVNLADSIVYCGLTQIEETDVLTDGFEASDPAGMPNESAIIFDVPPTVDYTELVIETASLFNPLLDAMVGQSDAILDDAGDAIGRKGRKRGEAGCLCSCEEEDCPARVYLITWSKAYCSGPGRKAQVHPGGKNIVSVYPTLVPRPNTNSRTTNAELGGRQYLLRSEENPVFGQGPGNIIPASETPYDRDYYEFLSDSCPPDGCACESCTEPGPAPVGGVGSGVTGMTTNRASALTASAVRKPTPAPAPTKAETEGAKAALVKAEEGKAKATKTKGS